MSSRRVAKVVVQRLESLNRAGVTHLRKPPKSSPKAASASRATPRSSSAAGAEGSTGLQKAPQIDLSESPLSAEDRDAALAALAQRVAQCTRCRDLARSRTQTVFGVGNPCPRLVFMGEAPGEEEDRQGLPFVGKAGQLLTDIIVKGMRLKREDVYILNTLKCRPPGNRTPDPAEAANCREYLDAQLAILRPEFVCCLGAVAAQNLLGTSASIGSLRGRVHTLGKVKVICTYHPAYVLRYPPAKRQVWDDIQLLMREMAEGSG